MFKIILGLITAVVASLHATPAQAAQKANETDATTSATYVLSTPAKAQKAVVTGAERTSEYLKLLKGKRVALFSNQTGVVGNKHVLDVLLENKVNVVTIFSPEHGFRGKADAGEKVSSSVDEKTGVNIYSLYGVKGGAPDDAVHGMTLGELALMINGEGWLKEGRKCDLKVVKCLNYNHQTRYRLPVIPSPNLPNMTSIYLYPSLCYFEATDVSLGRGTDKPFQQFGHPDMKGYAYSFTPESREGAKNPPQLGHTCYGRDLSQMSDDEIIDKKLDLTYLIEAYRAVNTGDKFFTSFFEKLIGVDWVRTMIEEGKSADEIRARWMPDVEKFKKQRKPYLLYKE